MEKHNRAFFDSIREALDLIIYGGWPVFPKRENGFFSKKTTLTPNDISDLATIRQLLVQEKILTASAETIQSIVTNRNLTGGSLSNDVISLLAELFNYSEFREGRHLVTRNHEFYWETPSEKEQQWGGYEYLQYHLASLKFCPYCNADMVYAFVKGTKTTERKVGSALDHFYPQSKYPFLALSLYNLIPACSRCNSQMKGAADISLVANPYIDNIHHNVVFFPLINTSSPPLDEPCSIAILPREGCNQKTIKYVCLFELENLYSSAFARDALLCMERVRNFTSEFRRDFALRIGQKDSRLVDALFLGMRPDESDINITRLGKMTLDIIDQFET